MRLNQLLFGRQLSLISFLFLLEMGCLDFLFLLLLETLVALGNLVDFLVILHLQRLAVSFLSLKK